MTKNEILTKVAAIITTLEETDGSPESMLYIFCGMDMENWQVVRDILVRAGYVSIKGNFAKLTPLGIETAMKLNKVIGQ